MAYNTGSIITKGEYNTFVAGTPDGTYDSTVPNAGIVWGTGFGRFGYGQDLTFIEPVSTGQVIAAQDWDNIDAILSNIIDHQLGPGNYGVPSPVQPGQLITPISRLNPGIQLAYTGVGKCFAPTASSEVVKQYNAIWGGLGRRKLRFTQTLTFDTADKARWFFNAGGKLRLTFGHTPVTVDAYSTQWENITQSAGVITIGYRDTVRTDSVSTPGSFDLLGAGLGGFWANTSGATKEHFRQRVNPGGYGDPDYDGFYGGYGYGGYGYGYGGYGYGYYTSENTYMKVELQVTDSDGINGNLGRRVSVITTFVLDDTVAPVGDIIKGTFKVGMTISKPTPDFLPIDHWSSYSFIDAADVIP